MTKKTYLMPTTNVLELKSARLVCASLMGVNSTGLDDTLDYGDGDTTEQNAWVNAW